MGQSTAPLCTLCASEPGTFVLHKDMLAPHQLLLLFARAPQHVLPGTGASARAELRLARRSQYHDRSALNVGMGSLAPSGRMALLRGRGASCSGRGQRICDPQQITDGSAASGCTVLFDYWSCTHAGMVHDACRILHVQRLSCPTARTLAPHPGVSSARARATRHCQAGHRAECAASTRALCARHTHAPVPPPRCREPITLSRYDARRLAARILRNGLAAVIGERPAQPRGRTMVCRGLASSTVDSAAYGGTAVIVLPEHAGCFLVEGTCDTVARRPCPVC